MKKGKLIALLMAGTLLVGGALTTTATTRVRVFINTQEIYFLDGAPYVDANNRTQLPVRYVSEKLGAKVDWDATSKRITIVDGKKNIILTVGQNQVLVDGVAKKLDTAAAIKGNRTYVPLRFVSEALGATVKWDSVGNAVYISNGNPPLPEEKVFTSGGFIVPVVKGTEGSYNSDGEWNLRTKSGLGISGYDEPYGPLKVTITFVAGLSGSGTYLEKYQEIGEILKQKISEDKVNEIIKYASQKTDRLFSLEPKTFYEDEYVIYVTGKSGATNVRVSIK